MSTQTAARASTDAGADAGGARVGAPLLEELLSMPAADRQRTWCDLGRVQPGLVQQLVGGRNRLVVADLPAARAAGEREWNLVERVLDPRHLRVRVDIWLGWDMLNYMTQPQLAAFSDQFIRHASPDCRLHALVHYSGRSMPAEPTAWRIRMDSGLAAPETETNQIEAPRYSPKALEKAMPGLRVERTMLLNNGMQEFLFRLG